MKSRSCKKKKRD